MTIAYVREGVGGTPLLLLHGYPETKRIWWRNIAPLAAAGFEVIAPDFRGHGDSSLAPDDFYDIAAFSIDCYTLVHDVLGHERCAVAGGDVGGVVLYDLGLRYPGFVHTSGAVQHRAAAARTTVYAARGLPPDDVRERRAAADYFVRQATDPDGLLAELDTPDAAAARTSPACTAIGFGARRTRSRPTTSRSTPSRTPTRASSARVGACTSRRAGNRPMEDVPRCSNARRSRRSCCTDPRTTSCCRRSRGRPRPRASICTGPLFVPNAGHFLQWEQPQTFNNAVTYFLRDLVVAARA